MKNVSYQPILLLKMLKKNMFIFRIALVPVNLIIVFLHIVSSESLKIVAVGVTTVLDNLHSSNFI